MPQQGLTPSGTRGPAFSARQSWGNSLKNGSPTMRHRTICPTVRCRVLVPSWPDLISECGSGVLAGRTPGNEVPLVALASFNPSVRRRLSSERND